MKYMDVSGKRHRYEVFHGRDAIAVWLDGRTYYVPKAKQTNSAHDASNAGSSEVSAMMPGKLLRIEVQVGDSVTAKQPLAIMESMKMETALYAPKAGRVREIRCEPGQVLEMGQVIVVIE
ncbi:MAG TPA: acetyl-CoA carboxylase biotin carboxyl carrier protein subunit [Terriglobia bacterium]|nr:acetyl-CoA carboxylase biotin carboxyl carrier protein subunit [Terriglobia bacterium]